jgi:hypothetical protein
MVNSLFLQHPTNESDHRSNKRTRKQVLVLQMSAKTKTTS